MSAEPEKTGRPGAQRWVVIAGVGLALITGSVLLTRGRATPEPTPTGPNAALASSGLASAAADDTTYVGEIIDEDRAKALLSLARDELDVSTKAPPPVLGPARLVVLTLSRGTGSAAMVTGSAPTLDDAVRAAVGQAIAGGVRGVDAAAVRLDVLESLLDEETLAKGQNIALGRDLGLVGLRLGDIDGWLLPDEVLAHGLFDAHEGAIDLDLVRVYLKTTQSEHLPAVVHVRRARFGSFVTRADQVVRIFRGNPPPPRATGATLVLAADAAGDYMLRHERTDGTVDALFHGSSGGVSETKSAIGQALASYALYELAEAQSRHDLRDAADRGVTWLLTSTAVQREATPGSLSVAQSRASKVGTTALVALALVKSVQGKGVPDALAKAKDLGGYLLAAEDASGAFPSREDGAAGDPETRFDASQAAFALARLAEVDPDPKWSRAAEKAVRHLIDAREKSGSTELDPWLLLAIDALPAAAQPPFLAHATKVGDAIVASIQSGPYPDWEGAVTDPPNTAAAATSVHGLVALTRALERAGRPAAKYRDALERVARFTMGNQLTKERTLLVPVPAAVLGGFKRSLTSFDVSVDCVAHAVSALLAYRGLLGDAPAP